MLVVLAGLGTVLGVAVLLLLLLSFLGFWSATHPPRLGSGDLPTAFGWPFVPVELSVDGLRLRGWLVPGEGSGPRRSAIVMLHGYPFDKSNVLPLAGFLRREHDVLLFDFRGLGESEGRMTTIGYREVRDLRSAVDYLRACGYERIGVWGFSLGGAVALLGLAQGARVEAVVADSPYGDLGRLTAGYYAALGPLRWPLALLTRLWARLIVGVDPSAVSPARAVRGVETPILLIHSRDDEQIPWEHAQAIAAGLAGNAQAETWLVDGVPHGGAWASFPEAYEARVRAFFRRHLAPSPG